jgi:hypothetical protein
VERTYVRILFLFLRISQLMDDLHANTYKIALISCQLSEYVQALREKTFG